MKQRCLPAAELLNTTKVANADKPTQSGNMEFHAATKMMALISDGADSIILYFTSAL